MADNKVTTPDFTKVYEEYLAYISGLPAGFKVPTFEEWLKTRETPAPQKKVTPTLSPMEQKIQDYWKLKEAPTEGVEGEGVTPIWETAGFGSEEEWRMAMGLDLSPSQKEQYRLEQERLDLAKEEAKRQTAYQEWQMAQPSDTALRQRLWESQQQAELAQMTAPSDWITRWIQTKGLQEQTEASRLKRKATGVEARLGDVFQTATPSEFEQLERRAMDLWSDYESARARVGDVGAPPAPEWLAKFVPSQTAGQPITKQATQTPSGQQWISTPWSQREGLRGYTEWSGGKGYQDILNEMAMMAPSTPSGAGRTQWSPAKQRA